LILISAIWQRLVWCALIGGFAGLLKGIYALLHRSASEMDSITVGLVVDTLVGTLYGIVLLGVPVSIWVLGRWMYNGHQLAPAASGNALTQGAGHAAMVGSTAAVPGAILGIVAGLFIGALIVGCIQFLSAITGTPCFESVTRHLVIFYLCIGGVGAFIGGLAGTFLGGAVGALFGGIRSLTRH
jgi:hypothetical protein